MAFDNPSNRGRALKIVDILAHVEKSATSNRANPAEIADMLAPVITALRDLDALPSALELCAATPEPIYSLGDAQRHEFICENDVNTAAMLPTQRTSHVPGGAWASDKNAPASASIRDAAASAPLPDLAAAMAVFATRMDEVLYQIKGDNQ